ncbi:MAG: putative signal-transduction protein containing cAMP-binding and CBS domain [Parcubacteria group bacterium Gr01-1014_31]|nr:MAG: putative signal-transduction protein containing cAMP-binding and CBS domain [Parcubacteria group bacterium Gr01-1014_31]
MHRVLTVRDVMITKFTAIPRDATIRQAAELMHRGGFSGAPVVDSHGKLTGVISEKDLFRALYPTYGEFYAQEALIPKMDPGGMEEWLRDEGAKPIAEFVKPAITTTPETPLVQIGAIMLARNIHRLPVLEDGRLVGMVSRRRLYQAIFNHLFGFTH